MLRCNSDARLVSDEGMHAAVASISVLNAYMQGGSAGEVKTVVMSVSPQSTASLAASHDLSAQEVECT